MSKRFAYCLCPSYRKPICLQSSMWLFERQTYPYKRMYILEDSGMVPHGRIGDIVILSTEKRFPNLPLKYQYLLDILKPTLKPDDAIFVWDDDDVYLEDYIEKHMEVLKGYPVSKLSEGFTYYASALYYDKSMLGHSALSFRAECLDVVPGWPLTGAMDFDAQFISKLQENFEFGDPRKLGPPSFIHRWTLLSGYHSSALSTGPKDEGWYRKIDEILGPKEDAYYFLEPRPDPGLIPLMEAAKFMIEQNKKCMEFYSKNGI